MTWVKICGLTQPEDVAAAVQAGANACGFVMFTASPRHVDVAALRMLCEHAPDPVERIAVLVAPDAAAIDAVAAAPVTGVQVHGELSPDVRAAIARHGLTLLRALQTGEAPDETASRYLVDAAPPGTWGGRGKTWDWSLPATVPAAQLVVAGGLNAENVGAAIAALRPFGVDVSSGVEAFPGRKDHAAVRTFVATVRGP